MPVLLKSWLLLAICTFAASAEDSADLKAFQEGLGSISRTLMALSPSRGFEYSNIIEDFGKNQANFQAIEFADDDQFDPDMTKVAVFERKHSRVRIRRSIWRRFDEVDLKENQRALAMISILLIKGVRYGQYQHEDNGEIVYIRLNDLEPLASDLTIRKALANSETCAIDSDVKLSSGKQILHKSETGMTKISWRIKDRAYSFQLLKALSDNSQDVNLIFTEAYSKGPFGQRSLFLNRISLQIDQHGKQKIKQDSYEDKEEAVRNRESESPQEMRRSNGTIEVISKRPGKKLSDGMELLSQTSKCTIRFRSLDWHKDEDLKKYSGILGRFHQHAMNVNRVDSHYRQCILMQDKSQCEDLKHQVQEADQVTSLLWKTAFEEITKTK